MLKKFLAGLSTVVLALGMAALSAAPASATNAEKHTNPQQSEDTTPYVLVAWAMPSWSGPQTPTWPQTLVTVLDLAEKDLDALDAQLTQCGTQYQVDLYNDSKVTRDLIAKGKLFNPGNPPEDFPHPSGWNKTYKLIQNVACPLRDAEASATPTSPTCDAIGGVTFNIANATWVEEAHTEPGTYERTAKALAGHIFVDTGTDTKVVEYTIAGKLDANGPDCYAPVPVKPQYEKIDHCGEYGSITLVDTAMITYEIVVGDGQQGWNKVVATAVAPYVLDPSAKSSWWIWLGEYKDCVKPSADYEVGQCYADADDSYKDVTFTFDNTKSTVAVKFSIPSEGIFVWVPAGETETVVVTVDSAGSSSLVVWAGGKPILVTKKFKAFEGCKVVEIAADPYSTPAQCVLDEVGDGSIWVELKEGVIYQITGGPDNVDLTVMTEFTALPPGDYVVKASAAPGYVLSGPDEWPLTIAAPEEDCELTTLGPVTAAATMTAATCFADGSFKLTSSEPDPELDPTTVFWTVNGESATNGVYAVTAPATVEITAVPNGPDYAFDDFSPEKSWSFSFTAPTGCDLDTLALTGSPATGAFALGGVLVALGAVTVVALRRREQTTTEA